MSLPVRPIWADRFQAPTADGLVSALPPVVRTGINHARVSLRRAGLSNERVLWQGVWCWTIALHAPGAYPSGNSVNQGGCEAILVPNPSRPQVCLAVSDAALTELGIASLSRSLRDVVAHAPAVCGVRWPTWEVRTREEAQPLIELALLLQARGRRLDGSHPASPAPEVVRAPAKANKAEPPVAETVRKPAVSDRTPRSVKKPAPKGNPAGGGTRRGSEKRSTRRSR